MTEEIPILTARRRETPPIAVQENSPDLWLEKLTPKTAEQNKYDHGHVLVYGGKSLTGAACMVAHAALRIGAGLCTISAPVKAAAVYRAYQPNIMVEERRKPKYFHQQMKDPRRNTIVIGPGAGVKPESSLREVVSRAVRDGRSCVLDADALTVFKPRRRSFYRMLGPHCVLTPHEGEFARIFPKIKGDRIARAVEAAAKTGAVILLKGSETVIAGPDRRIVINKTASPDLATGGAGDVLAGLIAGLLVRGLPPFEAACAGAWIHGRAAQIFGPGLMATDLFDQIPAVLRELS